MCFERAGDQYGEKLSKAAGLKASADRMHGSNPEMASVARRQAAEIFESIGKAEYAAECFYMLREYDRAGTFFCYICFFLEFSEAWIDQLTISISQECIIMQQLLYSILELIVFP